MSRQVLTRMWTAVRSVMGGKIDISTRVGLVPGEPTLGRVDVGSLEEDDVDEKDNVIDNPT